MELWTTVGMVVKLKLAVGGWAVARANLSPSAPPPPAYLPICPPAHLPCAYIATLRVTISQGFTGKSKAPSDDTGKGWESSSIKFVLQAWRTLRAKRIRA